MEYARVFTYIRVVIRLPNATRRAKCFTSKENKLTFTNKTVKRKNKSNENPRVFDDHIIDDKGYLL